MYFGASFRLNETTRFSQNEVVSCISLKKKEKKKKEANSAILNGTISLLFPLDAQRTREEEDFSPASSRSFIISLPTCTNPDTARAPQLPP
jgi:hypothetical protein